MSTEAEKQGVADLPAQIAREAAEARQNIKAKPEEVPGALGVLPADAPLPEGIKRYASDEDPGVTPKKAVAKKATPAKKKV